MLTEAHLKLHILFRNKLAFYGEELLASCPTPKLEGHTLLAVHDCLFSIFRDTWRPYHLFSTWEHDMLWWQQPIVY